MTAPAGRGPGLAVAVFVLVVLVGALWLALDRHPPEWDHANHLERAILCARDLHAGDVQAMLERSAFYPPLVFCLAGALYHLLPTDALFGLAVMWIFLGIGMLATYLLGRRVGGRTVGVVAAILYGTAPFVVFSALRFQLDLPLAAMVALSLWTLAATDAFARSGWSVWAGALFGLGMLTKPSFAVYVLPAIVLALWHVRRGRVALNVTLASLVAILVSLPWYGPRAMGMLAQVGARSGKQAAESGHPDPLSASGLLFYPTWFVTEFGAVAVVLFLVGLALAVRQRRRLVLASVLVPFALFALIQNKNLRYMLPVLPAAAVIAAIAFDALRARTRAAVAAAVAIAAVVQVTGTAFGIPSHAGIPGLGVPWILPSPPTGSDWQHRQILAVLAREAGPSAPTVSAVPNASYFSVSNFRYYAVRDELPFRWVRAWDESPLGIDFMITKTGDQGPSWTAAKPNRIGERFGTDAHLARVFPVIGEFPLPDGSVATVRARRVPPYPAAPERIAAAVELALRREVVAFARDVDGLELALDRDADVVRGRIRRLVLGARSAVVGELRRRDVATLRIHDVRITAHDVVVNPGSAVEAGRLEVLDVGRITIDAARITGADLQSFVGGLKRFRRATVTLESGAAVVRFEQAGPDVRARVRFVPAAGRPFAVVAERVSVGRLVVPGALVNWVIRNYDPTARLAARLPVTVEVGDITMGADAIRIGGAREAGRR